MRKILFLLGVLLGIQLHAQMPIGYEYIRTGSAELYQKEYNGECSFTITKPELGDAIHIYDIIKVEKTSRERKRTLYLLKGYYNGEKYCVNIYFDNIDKEDFAYKDIVYIMEEDNPENVKIEEVNVFFNDFVKIEKNKIENIKKRALRKSIEEMIERNK